MCDSRMPASVPIGTVFNGSYCLLRTFSEWIWFKWCFWYDTVHIYSVSLFVRVMLHVVYFVIFLVIHSLNCH